MFSLTNRLRVSWLTVMALATFTLVGALHPKGVDLVSVEFARNASAFAAELLEDGEPVVPIGTVNMLRAALSADMIFLVAYGLLLGATLRGLTRPPVKHAGVAAVLITMFADATENVFALLVLRQIGEATPQNIPAWWFIAMNVAAVTKWGLAGVALSIMAKGWVDQLGQQTIAWRRWAARAIVVLAAVGAAASAVTAVGYWTQVRGWAPLAALVSPAAALLIQFRLLDTASMVIRFTALARATVIVQLVVAAFGPLALGPAANLLGGILTASNFSGVTFTALSGVVLIAATGTQFNLIRAYGWQRVGDMGLRDLDHPVLATGVFWSGVLAVSSLLFCVGVASYDLEPITIVSAVIIGAAAGAALLFAIEMIASRLMYLPSNAPMADTGLPFRAIPFLRKALNAVAMKTPAYRAPFLAKLLARLLGVGTGYVEATDDGGLRVLPGHVFAASQFALTLIVYAMVLIGKGSAVDPNLDPLQTEREFWVPTIASVVILFLLASWAFSAVAFYLDRYRVALVVAVLVTAAVTGGMAHNDYRVVADRHDADYSLATPGQVLRAFGDRPLAVAAAGGGIQAGAWTARVLEGLDRHLAGTLASRVAVVSSVSGGSMGALYFGAHHGANLTVATEQAMKSSLDQVANALIGDLSRVVGVTIGPDRGAALEKTWAERLPDQDPNAYLLSRWSTNARRFAAHESGAAPFPAFLLNSTIVETGQPVSFATTQMPTSRYRESFKKYPREYPVVESANRIFRMAPGDGDPARDVGLTATTAARLSAGFPYVSPAVAVHVGAEPFHLVDGGYYDVYGLVALSQWLDDALEEMSATGAISSLEIGVIVARGLASSDPALVSRLRLDTAAPIEPAFDRNIVNRGWSWQLTAPPVTALKSRTFGQWAGDVQVFRLLREKWLPRHVTIVPYVFDYPGSDPSPVCQASPLSWKLTKAQQQCIEKAWSTFEHDPMGVLAQVK